MMTQPSRSIALIAIAVASSGVIIAAAIVGSAPPAVTDTRTVTETTTTTTVMVVLSAPQLTGGVISETTTGSTFFQCSITGQPDGFYLRVVFDSNQTQVVGAVVTAVSLPDFCDNVPATVSSKSTFTTSSSTEWNSLSSINIGGYSITVSYAGQNYSLSANTAPLSITCASLSLPSGNVNVTQRFASSSGCH